MTDSLVTAALPYLSALVLGVVGVVVPLAYDAGRRWLEAKHVDTAVYQAIGRAGGVAYQALLTSGRPATDRAALLAAAAAGGAYLQATVPAALAAKGVAHPADLAGAELGKLLAGAAK